MTNTNDFEKIWKFLERSQERLFGAYGHFQIWEAFMEMRAPNVIGEKKAEENYKTLQYFNNFFGLTIDAHRKIFALELWKFFDKNGDNLSIQKILNCLESKRKKLSIQEFENFNEGRKNLNELVENYKGIKPEDIKKAKELLEENKKIIEELKTFRNQDLAHDQIKKEKNHFSVEKTKKLFHLAEEILNLLSNNLNNSTWWHFHPSNRAKEDTKSVVEYLQEYEPFRLKKIEIESKRELEKHKKLFSQNMKNPFRLLPAIDLLDGKPVRLLRGNYAHKTDYSEQFSLEFLARTFSEFASGIHVVDLDGAKKGESVNLSAIETIVKNATIPVEVGGGIRNRESTKRLLDLGVSRVILGTSALENPDFLKSLLAEFGAEKVVVGVDTKNGMVATHGWEKASEISAKAFLQNLQNLGVKTIIYTDISTDGTLGGAPIDTFEKLVRDFPDFEIIASGGIATVSDLEKLKKIPVAGAIFGKAFYEGKISADDLKIFSQQ